MSLHLHLIQIRLLSHCCSLHHHCCCYCCCSLPIETMRMKKRSCCCLRCLNCLRMTQPTLHTGRQMRLLKLLMIHLMQLLRQLRSCHNIDCRLQTQQQLHTSINCCQVPPMAFMMCADAIGKRKVECRVPTDCSRSFALIPVKKLDSH